MEEKKATKKKKTNDKKNTNASYSNLKKIVLEMFYSYNAVYRAEKGSTKKLHEKVMKLTEKLIEKCDDYIVETTSAALDSKDIKNIAEAVLKISEARALQCGLLTPSDVVRYVIEAQRLNAVKEGKAAMLEQDSTGVVVLPVINKTDDKEDK